MRLHTKLWQLGRRLLRRQEEVPFEGSASYWNERYGGGSNSGTGSYGRLAAFKAEVINRALAEMGGASVVEWGCGDGAQLARLDMESYIGVDVSPQAIALCKRRFINDQSKEFMTLAEAKALQPQADVALSLDVLFHLVEDDVYEDYMRQLFRSARLGVIVYSSNEERDEPGATHVRHRRFTEWIESEAPMWRLTLHTTNRYPFSPTDPHNTSFSEFYVFRLA